MNINHKALDVKVVPLSELQANDYNPNRMPDTEMDLLRESITTTWDAKEEKYRIIDGYHRYETLRRMNAEDASIIDLNLTYHDSIQLTILMNRIKGLHQVELMSDVVVQLEELGLTDHEICENLGMESEEFLRLKQQLGIAHAFRNHEYTNSWEIEDE